MNNYKNSMLRVSLLLIPLLFANNWAFANSGPTYISGSANPAAINAGESIHFKSTWNDPDDDEIFAVRVKYCKQGSSLCVTEYLDPIENVSQTQNYHFGRYIPITNGGTYEYQFIALDRMQPPYDSDDPLHSEEELGWHGGGTFTVIGDISQTKTTRATKLRMYSTRSSVNLSVDAERFPLINLGLDCPGTPLLTENDVSVFEDDRQQNIFDFIPPSGTSARIADIVFVHDDSGSLGDEAAQVKANIQTFIANLAAQNIDFRVSLVPYGGGGSFSPPEGKILHNGISHDNAADFINDVNGMMFDGGTERAFAAMKLAVTNTVWRTTTNKILILVTDEDNDYSTGDPSETELIQLLKDQNVTMYGLTAGDSEFNNIATATGGQVFNITDPFSSILNDIGQLVSSRYLIQYLTDNAAFDGQNRVVRVNSRLCDATGSYTPEYQLDISLTAETEALIKTDQPENVSLKISANIAREGSNANITASLFYQNNTLGTFQMLPMINKGNNIYEGVIPDSSVLEPFVNFYISATDGNITRTFPSLDPNQNPFSIAILPNQRPLITHTPVTSAKLDQPIVINAEVTDTTREISVVRLYYRKYGQVVYQFLEVNPNKTADSFSGTIPASFVTQNGVEYYLYAKDNFGATTTVGTLDNPFQINNPTANHNPILDAIATPQTVTVGNLLTFSATATDPDGDKLEFSLKNNEPSGANIKNINDNSAVFEWIPSDPGNFSATVEVTDYGSPRLNDTQTVKITVLQIYQPPVQQNIPPTLEPISNKTIDTDDTLQIELNAIDPNDGDILSFSLVDAPDGASINDGVLTWKADQAGVFNFTVQVTDNGTPALSDQKTFEVTVNKPPLYVKPISNQTIEFGETLEVTLTVIDKDGNIVNDHNGFTLVKAPEGAEIKDGVLTWKADQVGVFEFTVKVTDNDNSITFEVTVKEPQFNLTTEISPINAGTIQIYPNKTSYNLDDPINLTATVKDSECYEFSHWEGDCSGSECSLIMDSDKKVIANFIGKEIKLNITAKNGKVEPEKSDYLCGEKVELTATPNANYQFLGWTGYISTKKNPISLVLKEKENNLSAIFGPTTNLRISPAKVHAKVGDELTFTASGSINGNYFWENYQGETLKYKVTEEGIFYIWVTDGKGFAWSLVDSTSLENAIILIRFAATNLNLSVGDKQIIALKAYDGNGNAKNILGDVILESENPDIAQVMQNGQVTARGVGTTNIIASYQDKQAKLPVTITAQSRVLQVQPKNIILAEGDSQTVKAYEINQSGTKSLFKDAILNIRNTQIASVKNNLVTGVKKGSTWLDIVAGNLNLSVPIIVSFRQALAITPSTATIIKGKTAAFSVSGGKPPYKLIPSNGIILSGASDTSFIYQSNNVGSGKVSVTDSSNETVTANIDILSLLDVTPKKAKLTSQETVTLQAIGGEGNYFWTATKGELSSLTDRRVEYTAPKKTGTYTVTVRDGLGNTTDVIILVGEDLLLSQQQLFLEPDESVELNILGGESPYTVEVDAGNAEIIDDKLKYKAPKVAGNYTLTVSDNRSKKVSAEIKIALDLIITPLSSRIDAGEELILHAAGGFGTKRWIASKGALDKFEGETVTWTAPKNFGPSAVYVTDDAGATASAKLEVASSGFAVTPSVRHVFPNKNANFTAIGGATPYTWTVEQGDFNAIDAETINYQADNIRGSYKVEVTDNSGKKAQAQVNVYSTKLFASPKILYINKGETLPITIGGGTGDYTVRSTLTELAQTLKLEKDERSITTEYTAPKNFEGRDTIHILDTAGNLASIKVEIAKKDDIIDIYAGADGKVDEAEMNLAIDDFFAGQAWLDRTIMFKIAEQFVD